MSYKSPDLQDRKNTAAAAKKAMLEKFRAAANDPAAAQRKVARAAVSDARVVRATEREAARKAKAAELAAQSLRDRQLAELVKREAEETEALAVAKKAEREGALAAEQKIARDARYAARKAAKKVRRRGY
jgi:hypothetical protein